MSERPIRDILRFDYRVYNQSGKKVAKDNAQINRIVKKLDKDSIMERNKLIDEESKISLEVSRFWKEYELDRLYEVDDIKECINELKNIVKRFEDVHVDLKRELEEQHAELYANYENNVKVMTNWIKEARDEIIIRKREYGNKDKDEVLRAEKTKLRTDEKYFKVKIEQFLLTLDIENEEFVDEIEKNLVDLKGLRQEHRDLYNRIEILFGDIYEEEFNRKAESINEKIEKGQKRLKNIKHENMAIMNEREKTEARRKYDEKIKFVKYALDEIESRSSSLLSTYTISFEDLNDYQILEKKKDATKIDAEFNTIMEKISELVKEVPLEYDAEFGILRKVFQIRDNLRTENNNYQSGMELEIRNRDISAKKLQNSSLLKIELAKFKGYGSEMDIYTFQTEFEKLISPNIQNKLLPDYLKKNYLDGHALLLVKEIPDLENIWTKLKESFGCTMLLLQNKLSEVRTYGLIWKIREKEKLIPAISKLLNSMGELRDLAAKHGLKDQLYHHSYLGIIYDLIGNERREKFIAKHIKSKLTCEEKWKTLMEFLTHELRVKEEIVLDEKSRQHHFKNDTNFKTKDFPFKHREKPSFMNTSVDASLSSIKCVICGKDDHVATVTKRGKRIVHYFSCEKFVKMKPSERFQELKANNLCFQCLYPGAKRNHEGNCFDQYACKHSSHKQYSKGKHVLVCEEHKNDLKNKDLFEEYKLRFITNSKVEYKDFSKQMKLSFYSGGYTGKADKPSECSIFMLQTIKVEGKTFNLFYDTGCGDLVSRRGAVAQLEKMGRANNEISGPLILTGVGDHKSVCEHGVYKVRLPLYDGKEANLSGLCLDKVTSDFPKYNLQEVQKDICDEYQKNGLDPKNLPKLPNSVGGETDFMIGIQYLKYFPKEKFRLPSGLTIYESGFANVDGSRGVVGGPHSVFTEVEKRVKGHHISMGAYFSKILLAYRHGYNVSLDVPLLCAKKYDDVLKDEPSDEIYQNKVMNNEHSEMSNLLYHKQQADENDNLVFINQKCSLKVQKKFEEIENAGTDVSYRCVKCRNCLNCKLNEQIEHVSIQEEIEQGLIDKSVHVDIQKCETIAKLPFVKNPIHRLSPNEHITMKIYKSQIRKLEHCVEDKNEVIKSEQKLHHLGFADFVDNLTDEQKSKIMNSRIKHFIPWRAVWNNNSISTPCRLVFDASQRTNSQYSLNSLLAKGRNNMNKLVEIAIRWMIHKCAFHTDIQKMYNTIRLDEEHWCYQLYLWDNELNPANVPKWKVIKTLIYGVKSSGNQAERGLRQTAELQKDKYPRINAIIQKDIYVDDCLSGESTWDEARETTDNLKLVLNRGGFCLKGLTFSGSDPPSNLSSDGKTVNVAGMKWFSKEDKIALNIEELNFEKRKRGKKPTTNRGIIPEEFTRRDCVGKVAEVFDLLGKVTPITAGMKLDLRELTRRKLDWDDKIPIELKSIWKNNFEMMKEIGKIKFNRAVVPKDAINLNVETIDTADASQSLVCAAIYARFKRRNGEYSCQLVFSRSKIVPENTTMPRAELSAAVLNARTGHVVQLSFGKYFHKCIKLTDSQVVLHWINNTKLALKQWIRNRVIEINRLTEPDNWEYVRSTNMIADLGTRKGAKIVDISENSLWVNGYPWMKLEEKEFPTKTVKELKLCGDEIANHDSECLDSGLSDVEWMDGFWASNQSNVYVVNNNNSELEERYRFSKYVIDPNKFRLRKVVRILAIVMLFVNKLKQKIAKEAKSNAIPCNVPSAFLFKHDQYLIVEGKSNTGTIFNLKCKNAVVISLTDKDIQNALKYFYRKATEEVKNYVEKRVYQKISKEIDGILYYTGRILPSQTFNGKLNLCDVSLDLSSSSFCVPLTDSKSPFAYSLVNETHWYDEDAQHSGVETVLRYAQKTSYIIEGRRLVKKFRKECVRCRILAKKAIEVAMGPTHHSNLNIAPAFFMCQVDIFGPVNSYSNVNKRATVKIWFVVFCCCCTGAIDVKIMEDYSTESFILGFIRFACKVGYPKRLMPDEGSQLVKGCKIMKLEYYDIKHRLHERYGVEFETCPVGAHYMHGKVERKIKHVQESFLKVTTNCRLSMIQWETLGDQVANSVNNQPIAIGNIVDDVENLDILTPNRLLLGRNNNRSPAGSLIVTNDPRNIIKANNDIFSTWFKCWLISYIPTLLHQPKWFNSDRDTKVGDVVLFLKSNKEFDKQYQYGIVKNVKVGKDEKIREIEIEYQNHNEVVKRCTNRGCRDVVVIHPVDELGILFELGAVAKSIGYYNYNCTN